MFLPLSLVMWITNRISLISHWFDSLHLYQANPLDGLTADYLAWSGLEKGKCLERCKTSQNIKCANPVSPRLACAYASNSTTISSNPEKEVRDHLICFQIGCCCSLALIPWFWQVVSIVLYNLMTNRLVKPQLKDRLRGAAHLGRDGGQSWFSILILIAITGECLQLGCKTDWTTLNWILETKSSPHFMKKCEFPLKGILLLW